MRADVQNAGMTPRCRQRANSIVISVAGIENAEIRNRCIAEGSTAFHARAPDRFLGSITTLNWLVVKGDMGGITTKAARALFSAPCEN